MLGVVEDQQRVLALEVVDDIGKHVGVGSRPHPECAGYCNWNEAAIVQHR